MGEWEMVKLGSVATVTSGGTPKKEVKEYYENGTIPWVKTGDLKTRYIYEVEDAITERGLDNSSAKIFPVGTVLLAMYGATIGACSILKIEASTNQACAALLPSENFSDSYLYYYLMSIKYELIALGVGGAQPNISGTIIKNIKIPLPPLPVQQQIADVLDRASALVEKRKAQIEKMDLLIKSQFIEMFGDPVMNPMGWEEKELSGLGSWGSGGTPPRSEKHYFKGDINWYSAGELNEFILHGSIEKISLEAINNTSAKLFPANSLFVGMYDTAAFKLSITPISASSNQACANITPDTDLINVYWLYYSLQIMRPFFMQRRRGIRQKNLNLGMIKSFIIPLPPLALQNEFATLVEQVETQKSLLQQSLAKLALNYKSLMQKCFRGEIFK